MNPPIKCVCLLLVTLTVASCDKVTPNTLVQNIEKGRVDDVTQSTLSESLRMAIRSQFGSQGIESLILPESDDYNAIPQDANNPITVQKVALGQMLFHDTAFALDGLSAESKSWSCASCHHAAAGFKSGIPQGIAEGGIGFGHKGARRVLSAGFDGDAPSGADNLPDIQPVASPSILNTAYQSVMLWNGQFGNEPTGSANSSLPLQVLAPDNTPKTENRRQLSGIETQAIAGIGVHRLNVNDYTALQTNKTYQDMWRVAYGGDASIGDVIGDAGKAIAAFERTVLSNKAPFQLWLRGDNTAMRDAELRGAALFFGKAGCVACHQGPALSSVVGASEDEIFFAIGFQDFDITRPEIHGSVSDADSKGRGGFTGDVSHDYKFKIPQLYNLADTSVLGHGASFRTIREVIDYKNRAIPQNEKARRNLDWRFTPLGLTHDELNDLEQFLTLSLYDPELQRYQPKAVPSGECLIVDPLKFDSEGLCP